MTRPQYWQDLLVRKIDRLATVSAKLSKPLVTTECWAIVDYKDWPLLKWDWVKDLCTLGAQRAASSGQWLERFRKYCVRSKQHSGSSLLGVATT
jgi:hypothetical protein